MEEHLENKKNGDLTPVGELIACCSLFGEEPEYNAVTAATQPTYDAETTCTSACSEAEKDGFCADYEKDGVLHCGVCHKPKYALRKLLGKERAFPIPCDCQVEESRKEAEKRRRQDKLLKADACRRHAIPYPHMYHWDFDHDDEDSPKITDYAKDYALHFPEMKRQGLGLFLFGAGGTGKTFTALQIVNALCDEGYRCLVITFLDIVTDLLSLNRENRREYIQEICSHDLLVFDDYGTEPGTYFSDMNVLKIVTTCYQKRIPMIVTTSLPPEVLNKESNATRKLALSRLKERCYCLTLANTKRKTEQARTRWVRFRDLLGIEEEGE